MFALSAQPRIPIDTLGTILALLTGIAGWFYMFYSRAAERLADLEEQRLNRRRVTLRRFGGGVMLVLAVLMYLGFAGIDPQARPKAFIYAWLGATALLGVLVALALLDVRLTVQLRRRRMRARGGAGAAAADDQTPLDHDRSRT